MSNKIIDPSKVKAKKMMLLFGLLSITMTFAGLTSAYIVSKGRPDWLVDFELPTLFLVIVVMLVIFKNQFPTSAATWLIFSLIIFMAASIQFYARWRRKN